MPNALWTVEDGAIKHVEKRKGPTQADGQPLVGWDLITTETYDLFELSWEWKMAEGGNSGVKYNVSEQLSTQMAPPHAAKGWEYQLLDDEKAEDNKIATHRAGALYDLLPPSETKRLRPVGEWNTSRIVVKGNHGEHWLNGEKVVEYELWSDDWKTRVQNSKFKDMPRYGLARSGHIALQDHGDWVAFRNIRIRRL